MRHARRTIGGTALLLGAALLAVAAEGTLDEGLLDPVWFGEGVAFRTTGDIDYLWVKEGFSPDGKTLWLAPWEEPQMRGKKRDAEDSAVAFDLTERMPNLLRGALASSLGQRVKLSREAGDLKVWGRFVDVNAGSKAAKWMIGMGAGSASATWDLKVTDAATGELLVAVHHRAISGTNMSEIDDKIIQWLDEDFGKALQAGLGTLYAKGKPAKK